MSVASDLKVLREATADELRVTGPGRKSQFDPIVAELAGQLDKWCVVYEGPDAERVVKSARCAQPIRVTRTEVRLSGDKVLMRRSSSPAVPPAPAWRPEGLPAGTWSSLTPRDRERAAVAIARAPKALRAVAIAELEVPVDVLEQTNRMLRNKGIIG